MLLIQPLRLVSVKVFILFISVPFAASQTWQHRPDSKLEYLVSTDDMTCHEAQNFCRARGAYTVTLQDANDKDYVNKLGTHGESFLTGLYKPVRTTIRRWEFPNDLYTANDANWDGPIPNPIRDYCECTVQRRSDQLWEIVDCAKTKYPFVCSRIADRCFFGCFNGGTCRETDEELFGYICDCTSGYRGSQCQQEYDVDECTHDSPCMNGATCINTPGSYYCECPAGYQEQNCTADVDECTHDSPCMNGATCINTPGSYYCECPAGYQEQNCTADINECDLDPLICQNDGRCANTAGSYVCNCPTGFQGNNCQEVTNDCEAMNGTILCEPGYCVDGFKNYTCVCPDGSSGAQFCTEDVNDDADVDGGDVGSFEDDSNNDDSNGDGAGGNFDDSTGERNSYLLAVVFTCLGCFCFIP